jgi:acyl-CoA synthetase (AMP-forming)/AMP-acid ligase II
MTMPEMHETGSTACSLSNSRRDGVSACANEVESHTRIHQAALEAGRLNPDASAVTEIESGRSWTYGDLGGAIASATDFLTALDVRPGDRVMLVGENSATLAALILGLGAVDATAVLENARRTKQEIARIREHAQPRRVIYLVENSPEARQHAVEAGATIVEVDGLDPVGVGPVDLDATPDAVLGTAQDIAVQIYTTGTTGAPKGVMLTHANLLFLSRRMLEYREMNAQDRVYCVLPITHVMGLAVVFGGTLRAGGHLLMAARFEPAGCADALSRYEATVLQGAPAMFAKLAQYAASSEWTPPSLRLISAGGAPIDPTVKAQTEALFGLPLHNGYGLTEACALCWTRLNEPRDDTSVGKPVPGVEVKVLDVDGKEVPQGAVGELWARGPQIMTGYFRDPERTAAALVEGGWFCTEDLARVDEAGNVFIVGRTKELIISGDFDVYPLEVENALNAPPAIAQAAVVGRDAEGSEEVVAVIELMRGSELTMADLKAFLSEQISPYKRPKHVYVVAALPASPNGKLLKAQIRRLVSDPENFVVARALK